MPPKDCWDAFTVWSYSSFSEYLTIEEKQEFFLTTWIPGDAGFWSLFAWRAVCFVWLWYFLVDFFANDEGGFKYLTNWGFCITALTYMLFMIHYAVKFVREAKATFKATENGETVEVKETAGTKLLWQFLSFTFGTSLTVNIMITLIYWMFLAVPPVEFVSTVFHTTPLIATLVDFVLNMIVIELNLSVWIVTIALFYFLVNYLYTELDGTPVYTLFTWHTWT